MCGIAGVVDRDATGLGAITIAMRDTLAHRGPDGAGIREWPDHGVALAHRRLAIIDRSPAGANPLSNEDGTVWVVFNGEICNFRSLRTELQRRGHAFRSEADTEVVVHAYEEWGTDHVSHLRGFFAYAVYDGRGPAARVLLVRDRLGVKPLYYSTIGQRLIFGSEIKAVLAHPAVAPVIDRSALFDYFTYSCIPSPKTAYHHIRAVPAGHMLSFEDRTAQVNQYWDVAFDAAPVSPADAVAWTRDAVTEAVDLYLESDVTIGAMISGGIDSSMVTAIASRSRPGLPTFTLGFDIAEKSEAPFAARVARELRTTHHEAICTGADVPNLPHRMLGIFDEPYADGSAVPTMELAAMAGRHVKVVLSGDGGDEVFGGYNRYSRWLSEHGAPRPLMRVVRSWASDPFRSYVQRLELFTPEEKRRLIGLEWSREFADYDDYWSYRKYWRADLPPATRLQYLDLKTYLPDDILTKVDRAAMAASVEVRPPLLDHVLVERILPMADAIKMPDGAGKHLVAPNGVDDRLLAAARSAGREALRAALGLAPDRKYVCYTGQLFAGRNVEAIVEALTQLPHEFNALLVGGESAADVERIASHAGRCGAADRIRLLGHQPSAIAAKCQVAADVLVVPYHPATTPTAEWCSPLKAAEYVASGTPIAAYRLAALEEFFAPGEVSWAPDLTTSGLAAAIVDASRRSAPMPRDARRLDALSWATRANRIARFVEARRD